MSAPLEAMAARYSVAPGDRTRFNLARSERGHVFTDRLLMRAGLEETMMLAATRCAASPALRPKAWFNQPRRFSDLA